MKQLTLTRIEHRKSTLMILIMLGVALIASPGTRGSAFSPGGARTLEPQATAQESKPKDVRELKVGAPIERELAGGDTHSYRVMLTTGQYFHVIVEQKGIDVVVRLFGPDGQKITEVDSPNGTQGPEPVSVIAAAAGEYRLEVVSPDKAVSPGRYEIRIEALREGTSQDTDRVAVERLLAQAAQLRTEGTAGSLRKAIEKYSEALPLLRGVEDRAGEALTLNEIGSIYWQLSESQKALEYYRQALPLRRVTGDSKGEAEVLHNLGTTYWQLGDNQKALDYYSQALPLRRAASDRIGEAITLGAIGSAYSDVGKLREALDYYNQSLPLRRALGDRRGEANTLSNIGSTYSQMGELQKALEYNDQALVLRRATGDRRGEAATLDNIGVIYWQLGEPQKALEYHNRVLSLRRGTGDRRGEFITLHNIGTDYRSLREPQKALEYYNQALSLARATGDRWWEANTLDSIGAAYRSSDDLNKALEHYNQALLLERAVGDRRGEAITLYQIGASYISLGKAEEALDYLRQALPLHRAIDDRASEAVTLQYIARAERNRGRLKDARAHIESALHIIESTRSQFISQDLRTSYSASKQDYYTFYIDLLMRMHPDQPTAGNDVAALQASERARARGLLELLAEARIDVKQGIAPTLKQREKDLEARISWIQSQLIQANSRGKPDQNKISGLEEEFTRVESESEQLEMEIRQKHPRYAMLHYPTPLGLKAIQEILDEKTVLLEYSLGKEASFLFVISKNGFLTAQLPAASLLANQVTTLREAVAAGPDRMALSNYLQKARSLYQELVEPANRLLSGKQALIIVPDGILHYLPFEVLLQSDSGRKAQVDLHQLPYLIRNYAISYAPSASVLANLHSRDRTTQTPRKAFLAYGDPLYGKTESAQTGPVRSAVRSAFGEGKPWKLQQLPESRREVERIAKLYPREQVGVFLGEQASEENVKAADRASQYRFVHFAVHGLLNESKPQYSGLVLSLPRSQSEKTAAQEAISIPTTTLTNGVNVTDNGSRVEDGLLQVYEIFNLKLNADLVVLSACETGLGKDVKGEGLVGLTQAFLYAGTPSLAVSLWKVQDKSTAELMVRFYRHLNDPTLSKAEALRQAQLEMIRKGDFSHPYYWAGFVLLGQP